MGQLEGITIGQYRLIEQVGRGGMATVYKAYQASLDRMVAVKVLPANMVQDAGFLERFRREATAIAKLRHPNILTVYDFGEATDLTYIVMEYVQGGTLKERLGRPLPLEWCAQIIGQVADALDFAHSQGIVHRDVKPANVLMVRDDWALLSDFGIAKMMESSAAGLTGVGVGIGTPEYMSPEQGQGYAVDGRSDIYSLGIMLFHMLTGVLPYTADTPLAVVLKHVTGPLPLPRSVNPAIPEAVERVILKATAQNPADRYQKAGEMVEALKAVALLREPVVPNEDQYRRPAATEHRTATLTDAGQVGAGDGPTAQRSAVKRSEDKMPLVIGGAIIAFLCMVIVISGMVFVIMANTTSSNSEADSTPALALTLPTPRLTTPAPTSPAGNPASSRTASPTRSLASTGIPFNLMADNALLEQKYKEAVRLAKQIAPDAELASMTIQIYPFGEEPHTNTYWDFYSAADGVIYYLMSFENGPVEDSDWEKTDPLAVFTTLPWRKNADWQALVIEGVKRMGANFTDHPDSVIHVAVDGDSTYDWRASFEDGNTLTEATYYLKGSQISNRRP